MDSRLSAEPHYFREATIAHSSRHGTAIAAFARLMATENAQQPTLGRNGGGEMEEGRRIHSPAGTVLLDRELES